MNPCEARACGGALLFVGDQAFGGGAVELDFGEEGGVELGFGAGFEELAEGGLLVGAVAEKTAEKGSQESCNPPGEGFRLEEAFGGEIVLVGNDEESGGEAEEADG